MTPRRPSLYQQRIEAILDQYRDKEARPAAERQHFARVWRDYVYPMRWKLLFATILALLINTQPYIWTTMMKVVIDTVLAVGKTIPAAELPKHFTWVIYLFFINS